MSLETGSYIGDLNPANPPGTDPKSQGDDHIRLEKSALRNSFAGFTGAILVTGTDGGVANAYTLTPTTAMLAYTPRMVVEFSPTAPNTGAATINVSGQGAKALLSVFGAPLVANDLVTGAIYQAAYDGTQFRLLAVTRQYVDQAVIAGTIPAQSLGFYRSDGTASGFTQTHTGYAQKEVRGADIASAATIDLTTATGNLVHITGSVGITGITIPSGAQYTLIFDGAPLVTHGAALLLPSSVNIQVVAGERMIVRGDTSGAVVIAHVPANATSADIKATTSSTKAITPAAHFAALGFNSYMQTADQIITVAGAVTIPHGLGRTPLFMHAFLKNKTAEYGYVIGDTTPIGISADVGAAGTSIVYGVAITFDATNIYVRYADGGGGSSVFAALDKTTGTYRLLTNANWSFFLRAFG